MRVCNVHVRNFRGIKEMDWSVRSRFVCLIGPGDSRKSTALDAIALALSPRWNVAVHDGDFFGCVVDAPIEIEVTLVEMSDEHIREDSFGHWLRGVSASGEIHDEPQAEDERALTIRLTIDQTLEPHWCLVKNAMEGQDGTISAKRRASLGVSEIDDRSATHLRWSAGSALAALSGIEEVPAMLADAHRHARQVVFDNQPPGVAGGAARAGELLRALGSAHMVQPRAGLDPSTASRGGSLILHDGVIPSTQAGLGSIRLASIAFQLAAFDQTSVVLIDEVELGLEPHRLAHLLAELRRRSQGKTGQVIITTHSPLVVEAVEATELSIARSSEGVVSINQLPAELEDFKKFEPQATIRSGPSAMLAARIVVCEGKTEVGICRALADQWHAESPGVVALAGCAFRNGGGNEAPDKAGCLARLGYPVCLFVDNDLSGAHRTDYESRLATAVHAGVVLVQWPEGFAIEDQLARDLPSVAINELLSLAAEFADSADPEMTIRDSVSSELGSGVFLNGMTIGQWTSDSGRTDDQLRIAIGRTAHKKKWFKNESKSEQLGWLVVKYLTELATDSQSTVAIMALKDFATANSLVVLEVREDV